MRCLESCTYQEMPNNKQKLERHIEHCAKCAGNDVEIVWENREFVAKTK